MKKVTKRKPVSPKRKPTPKKKKSSLVNKVVTITVTVLVIIVTIGLLYQFRNGLAYYLGFKSDKVSKENTDEAAAKKIADVRIYEVLNRHEDKVFGFDVSHYQGDIKWEKINTVENTFPMRFVFIRATAGKDGVDKKFKENWVGAKKNKLIRGAYHYYRADENSLEQAQNFIKNVKLKKGDLPPVLDIERISSVQSMERLKVGLKKWLDVVEEHYGVKPIIYSGEHYYKEFIDEEFSEYTNWIANYNFFVEEIRDEWLFWQFTEKARVEGIKGNVDLNIFNGTPTQLNYITIGN
ncbi:glycoside hydrolase family 25 protein [Flavobacterium sp. '19STA2R22 D10 B1']|uniref:glycoside hydrolase family 25 protein n=1 Tax=Flavobacterium aerium TaxID=3037261 RepID=UPI00278C2C6E|nr:glycoside hydrolase family 25 protein [Flavobacterium sp. '19STA2R22 D10 B1']